MLQIFRQRGGEPHPIDVTAGRNLRITRIHAGYSQEELGNAVGVTFQQIQKYERGTNRMSLSRAWDIVRILNINIAAFFDEPGPAHLSVYEKRHSRNGWSFSAALAPPWAVAEIIGVADALIRLREGDEARRT